MEKIKINIANNLAALRAIAPAIVALQGTVAAANAEKIQNAVTYAAQQPDANIVSGKSDKLTLQDTSHLRNLTRDAKAWIELLALHSDETIEIDVDEAREIADIINTPITAQEVEKSIRISVA